MVMLPKASTAWRDWLSALEGTSKPGLRWGRVSVVDYCSLIPELTSKKPDGLRWTRRISTGMMGQSSGREMWVTPKQGQQTISLLRTSSSLLTHFCRPKSSPPGFWLMWISDGNSSSSLYGVTNIYTCSQWSRPLRLCRRIRAHVVSSERSPVVNQ